LLIVVAYRMSFFSRGSHGRNNRGRGNWNRGPRRPRFSIHFDVDPQELNQLFQDGFFNWIGQGIVQPRPERPPFQPQHVPGIPVPPMYLCNLKFLRMMDGRRLFTQQSPTIVAGQIFHYPLLLQLLTQMFRFPLHTHLYSPPMQAKDSKLRPTMCMIKVKLLLLPPPLQVTSKSEYAQMTAPMSSEIQGYPT
jgi:hypothetical protein